MNPCPFCDGPTLPQAPLDGVAMVRHDGKPHCPVTREPITEDQWNTRNKEARHER